MNPLDRIRDRHNESVPYPQNDPDNPVIDWMFNAAHDRGQLLVLLDQAQAKIDAVLQLANDLDGPNAVTVAHLIHYELEHANDRRPKP